MPVPDAARNVLDLTDLFIYYRQFASVTGIQRVVERLAASKCLQDDRDSVFVVRAPGTDWFAQVDKALFHDLSQPDQRLDSISRLCSIAAHLSDYRLHQRLKKYPWKALRRKYRGVARRVKGAVGCAHLVPFEFHENDSVVLPGAYWLDRDVARRYAELRRRHRLHICAFVYDLIPITHPWCVDQETTRIFRDVLDSIVPNCDRFVAISKHVADEFSAYLKSCHHEQRPILTLPFGWDFPARAVGREAEAETLVRYGVDRRGFILVVGSLQLRKNHMLIVRAVHNLYPRLKDRMPPILFVGKLASEFLKDELAAIGYLDGRIRILSDVSDEELACLYAMCRFTIFPSFVEGWGLPVQESIAFGRPCLASSATSIPEAGLDLATYFDAYNLPEFETLLGHWIENPSEVAAAEARIAEHLATRVLPTWNTSASALVDFVASGTAEAHAKAASCNQTGGGRPS
jgi:glycosyltransferase involved in cell wall biosynthesis